MSTCEDRNYQCCEAMPPASDMTEAEYQAWYDAHVAAWADGRPEVMSTNHGGNHD